MFALTITFTPAPNCTSGFCAIAVGNYYSFGGSAASLSQCFPLGWQSLSQHYSPGAFPQGYTQACSELSASDTVTETRATCCPVNYECSTAANFNFDGQVCNFSIRRCRNRGGYRCSCSYGRARNTTPGD
ncbi:uncharacterized protein K444DRAFT_38869 [Hyaloscypha bicolor E]|uniref:Uncharacterized protein n=1 Tax=Hyaloscypha bicolor E TaxID=1095630 RepID=A0A2J6T1K2_9HELO|nr:uncharacterized protein K444DRAFT_38869 [Hyaloscypha bicolor E]PMD56899.1 hypothetical protein K444DRAFT_38869 [Hyaloscypha bicolor E]